MRIWKDLKGYEGVYEISNEGELRRLPKRTYLKPRLTYDGYIQYRVCMNGVTKGISAHREVAKAFIPNPENKETVNHKDGVKTNNNVDNLEWATRTEQTQHSYNLGLKKPVHTNRKLTKEDVREIRTTYVKGSKEFGSGALSKKYGITDANILKVVKGISYSDY